jgi:hypothetical protein
MGVYRGSKGTFGRVGCGVLLGESYPQATLKIVRFRSDEGKAVGSRGFHGPGRLSPLKNASVTDQVARGIVQHGSEQVIRSYTRIDAETRRTARDKLPNVTHEGRTPLNRNDSLGRQ